MRVIGFDTETDLVSASCLAPQLVCLTLAGSEDTLDVAEALTALPNTAVLGTDRATWTALVGADSALDAFYLAASNTDVMVAHNMAFDAAVLANHAQPIRSESYNPVLAFMVRLLEDGGLRDTMVAEKLVAVARDLTKFDSRVSPPMRSTFSLAHLVKVYLGLDISGDKTKLESLVSAGVPRSEWPWRYRYLDLLNVPVAQWPDKAASYAVEDAVYARKVFLKQRARPLRIDGHVVIDNEGRITNELEQTCAALALHMMAAEGAPVNAESVALFESDIEDLMVTYNKACRDLGIVRINRCVECGDKQGGTGFIGRFPDLRVCPICGGREHEACLRDGIYKRKAQAGIGKTYTKRLTEIVRWGYKGDPPLTDRPKNQSESAYAKWTPSVKTDEETLSVINHPAVVSYLEGKKATKWRGTYLPPLQAAVAGGGRLVSRPNVLVRSGRTSWTSPNLQNPPRKGRFRESFCAPEGRVMASIDYSALEMATLAQVCLRFFGQSRMAALINDGVDLHAWFGAKLLGISLDAMMEGLTQGDPSIKAVRQVAKIPNFGLPGGLGPKGLVQYAAGYGVFLELDQETHVDGAVIPSARDLCRSWKKAFPEMVSYFDMLSHESDLAADGRFTVKQMGSGRVRGGATYTSAANTHFQGLAADGAKAAMWELFKSCYLDRESPLFGCRMWAFIHDEFLFHGPEDTAHLWAAEASRIMVEQMSHYTPEVRQAAPPALMRAWYKGAEPVYDENGVLMVWCPPSDVQQPEGLTKSQQMLYAAGYDDAKRAGATPEEAHEEALYLVETGRVG